VTGRHRPRLLALALLALTGCGGEPPPAVILVSIDTLRADHLGLHGYGRPTSPFLDRFAANGVVFEHAFTSAAWTLIAHMTMLTGLYPEQHGVIEKDRALSRDAPLLAERLARERWQTVGLYHPGWVNERHGFARGFDVFRSHQNVEDAERNLFEELARLDPGRPFFLFLHLFDVHSDPTNRTPPTVFSAPPPFHDFFLPGATARLAGETYDTLKRKGLPPELVEAMTALYDDGIRHVDAALERVFTRLEAEGRLARALVIVTSDHGESLAQRDNWGHGGPWQEGIRVPLLLRLPGNERAGERVREVVHLVDVVATVLEFAGLPRDPLLPGCSLLRAPPPVRVVTGGNDPVQYLVSWPRKVTRAGAFYGSVDLEADPEEKDPQRTSAEEFEALRATLRFDAASIYPPLRAGELSPDARAQLEALGYAGELEDRDQEVRKK
jgi:arylsulfatase A-like enzyme